MSQAILTKELRESAGLLAVAGLGCAYILAVLTGFPILPWMGNRVYSLPFVNDGLPFALWMVGGGLAVLLGLKQTAWEDNFGTYYFLLQRPVARGKVFALKIAFGLAALLLVVAALILLYAGWASRPGSHDSPFFWSMTLPAWRVWIALPVLYLGAVLSGIRPARWFGTRLAPVAAAGLATGVIAYAPWYAQLGPGLWLASILTQLASVFYYVQHRDY